MADKSPTSKAVSKLNFSITPGFRGRLKTLRDATALRRVVPHAAGYLGFFVNQHAMPRPCAVVLHAAGYLRVFLR